MSKMTGDLVEIGVAKESSRGVAVAPAYGMRWSDLEFNDKAMTSLDESRSGILEDSRDLKVVGTFAEGSIGGPIRDRSIGLFLLSLFGASSSSGPTDSAYIHTITVQEGVNHQSLTLHRKDPNGAYDFALAMVSDLEINIETDKHVMFSAGFRSKAGASQARTVSYVTAESVFLPQHCAFKIAADQASLDGASATNIRSAKLTIAQEVEDNRSLGAVAPTDIVNKLFSVSLEVTIVRSADTYVTALLAGTAYAVRVDMNNTDALIGASSHPRLYFDLHKVILESADTDVSRGDLTQQTLVFKATYKESETAMIKAFLQNGVATVT
jgi:hypothetical protein